MTATELRFRLLRATDTPRTNPHRLAYTFGLQDRKGRIDVGRRLANGALAFDFALKVSGDPARGRPVFTGPHAFGPPADRFVYLSWFAVDRGDYINRVKAPLSSIGWPLVEAARAQGRPVAADLTGRGPGDARTAVAWFLAEP